MGNIFNRDFQDFIQALNQSEVAYILVGGYAVILLSGLTLKKNFKLER